MRRDEALRILREYSAELDAMGISSLSLFGSVARDEAGPASDVDLLVEFDRPVGYFELFDVQEYLEGILGRRVDLGTPDAIRRQFRDQILAEAVRAA
ncbi:MAG: nucleotidyltransferase family protein [Gemmatimonadota bacterium]